MTASYRVILSFLILATLLSACAPDRTSGGIEAAKKDIARSEFQTAIVSLRSVLQNNPSTAEARFLLGQALLGSGEPAAAELEFRKAKDLRFSENAVTPALAQALAEQRRYKLVIDEFASVKLSDEGSQADLDATLALALYRLGEADRARRLTDETLGRLPNHAPSLLASAMFTASKGDYVDALARVDKALGVDSKNVNAWQLRGDILLYGKNLPEQAADAYRKVIELRPNHVEANSALIQMYLAKSDLKAATQQFALMSKVLPRHPQTIFLQAQIAYLGNEFGKARDLLARVLKLAPENVKVLQLAGAVELNLNSLERATSILGKAVQLDTSSSLSRRLLAQAFLRNGQSARAMQVLSPNLTTENPDIESIALMAEAELLSGDIAAAENLFQRALKTQPDNTNIRTSLALTKFARGQSDAAMTELQSIAAADPGIVADMALISTYLRLRDLDRALAAVDHLQHKEPKSARPDELRGRILLAKKVLPAARISFEKALAKDPALFPAVAGLAAVDMAEGKPGNAEARYSKLLESNPRNLSALVALAQLKARLGSSESLQVRQLLERAIEANPTEPAPRLLLIDHFATQHQYDAALSAAQTANAAIPESPRILEALGRIQLQAGQVNQSISTLNKLASIQPTRPEVHVLLANTYIVSKSYNAAEHSFQQAIKIDPNYLPGQEGLIDLFIKLNQPDRALGIARDEQRAKPKEGVGFLLEGLVFEKLKNREAAISAYRKGLEKIQLPGLAGRLYALIYEAQGQVAARRFSDEWTKKHPGDAGFFFAVGNSAIAKNDLEWAERNLTEAVRLAPNDALAHNNLAWVRARQGHPGAVSAAERAVALAPGNPIMLDTLAFALGADNQVSRALETAKTVVALAPNDPTYRLNLARLLIRAGDKSSAKIELERLAPLGPKMAQYKEVRELLSKL